MKNNLWTFLLLAIVFSCGKDEDPGTQEETDDFFECTIDGEKYRIDGNNAFATLIDSDLFGIYGNEEPSHSGDYRNVYITLPGEPSTGKIELTDPALEATGVILDVGSSQSWLSVFGGSGELNITEKSADRIKGTFSYTCVNLTDNSMIEVKDGKFDVKIMQ